MERLAKLNFSRSFCFVIFGENIIMENEILDEIESDDHPKHGLKAYGYFLKIIFCFLCLFIIPMILGEKMTFGMHRQMDFVLIFLIFVFGILGMKNIRKSIKLEERTTTKTTLAEMGIFLLMILFTFPIIYATLMLCSLFL